MYNGPFQIHCPQKFYSPQHQLLQHLLYSPVAFLEPYTSVQLHTGNKIKEKMGGEDKANIRPN